jgi:ATP-binding cassette subfamily F protein 3
MASLLLSVNSLTKRYGPDPVLAGVTFDLRRGDRIGLVGPNGSGKTTLLRILARHEEMDAGTMELAGDARIGFLQQQPEFAAGRTVWEEARSALADLLELAAEAERVAQQLAETRDQQRRRRLGERFDHLQHKLHQRDGYNLDHRIKRVLDGLGFAAHEYHQQVCQLSGGQQNRLLLATLLLAEPDLMLLDEPSNHLDITATQWLEDFLIQSRQAVIVVSHDRYFLDKVTSRTFELFHGTVDVYPGNFSAYWRQKAERLEVERRTYEKQQTEIAKMQDFIRRHHYGQKHAQAEDRRKKLERIERVAPPREIRAAPMGFPAAARSGDIVIRAEGLTKGFATAGPPLFEDLTFDVLRGQRWGILGPNGCGKTTLLRCILAQIEPDRGRATLGAGVKYGYFDQHLACLDPELQVVEAIRPAGKEFNEQQRRDLLARFGLTGDTAFQFVHSLSGGERNRAALAQLAAADANLLVLDEPTNHLDLWARDRLEQSLKAFDGTLLFISHDRYFLNQVADHLLVAESDRFRVVDGNYDTYLHLVSQGLAGEHVQQATAEATDSAEASRNKTPKQEKNSSSARRKRRFPYRKVAEIEVDIFEREARVEEIHQALTTAEVLRNGENVKSHQAELARLKKELATLYEHWEEATELNW